MLDTNRHRKLLRRDLLEKHVKLTVGLLADTETLPLRGLGVTVAMDDAQRSRDQEAHGLSPPATMDGFFAHLLRKGADSIPLARFDDERAEGLNLVDRASPVGDLEIVAGCDDVDRCLGR